VAWDLGGPPFDVGQGRVREVLAMTYAIDDETAVKVTDGTVEVISEGHWKLLTP
jgi:hypothetical protein